MTSLQQLSIIKGDNWELKVQPLHKLFEERLNTNGTPETALIYNDSACGERKTSYDHLNQTANRLATHILLKIKNSNSRPNQDGDWIVAICMTPSDNLITTLLAIWKAGATYLPIDLILPRYRIQQMIRETTPVLLIYDYYDDLTVFSGTRSISFSQLDAESLGSNEKNITDGDALTNQSGKETAAILYTSGSTGVSKGVRHPHSSILNRLEWQWKTFPYSHSEKVGVFKTALTFVDSISEIWGPLIKGLTVVVIPKEITKDPEKLVAVLEKFKVERLVLVPTLLRAILLYLGMRNEPDLLYHLKTWVCSGEILPVALAQVFFDYFNRGTSILCNFYGCTENIDVTYFVCESKTQLNSFYKVPIGFPLDNHVVYILNDDLSPVHVGETGELFIAGSNLALGYLNGRDPEKFIFNPFTTDPKYDRLNRTGDLASIHSGCLMHEGRTDSRIKIRGYAVDLTEIEKNALTIEGVAEAIVICYDVGEIGQAMLCFVTLSGGSILTNAVQIENVLRTKLVDYMVPQVIIIDSIPLLINGKTDRQLLLKMYEDKNDDTGIHYDYTGISECKLKLARDLFHIIGEVVGRSVRTTISSKSSFYELGGNSLNTILTVTQLWKKGFQIGISDFINAKTLEDILNRMNGEMIAEDGMQLTAVPLALHHKNRVVEMIVLSFFEKGDLELWLKSDVVDPNYCDVIETFWEPIVEKGLSFVVQDANNQIIGVSINFDGGDEPEASDLETSDWRIIIEFVTHIEQSIRDNLLTKGVSKIFYSDLMSTASHLTAQENIAVIKFMEDEVLQLAKRKKFAGILTTNTNPLTQQLATDIFGYQVLLDYQVNQYLHHDGSKPFSKAPDSQRAIVHWKEIKH